MIHHAIKPDKPAQKQEISRTVEERKIDPNVTLRRTTIDEVEIAPNDQGDTPQ